MNTYNPTQVVDFPTRITNNTGTLIDTAFIDTSMYDKIEIKPFINGLSDHEVQIICLYKYNITSQQNFQKKKIYINQWPNYKLLSAVVKSGNMEPSI